MENKRKRNTVSFVKLFSLSSFEDVLLISLSISAAVVNGVCLPIAMILEGQMVEFIVYKAVLGSNGNVSDQSTSNCTTSQIPFVNRYKKLCLL